MCGCGSLQGLFFSPSACWTGVDGEAVEGGGGGGGEGTEGEGSGLGEVTDASFDSPPPPCPPEGLVGFGCVCGGGGTFLSRDAEDPVSAPSPSFSFSSLSSLDPRLLWHCPWFEGFIFHARRAHREGGTFIIHINTSKSLLHQRLLLFVIVVVPQLIRDDVT